MISFALPLWTLFLILLISGVFLPGWACAAEEASRNIYWAVPVSLPSAHNLYKVSPEIYRSAQPDKEAMHHLEKLGIRTVLNLRDNHDDHEEAGETNLRLERVGMTTWNIKENEVLQALAILRVAPKPILVHCMHGADRTGLVIAVYRMVEQRWTKQEALEEMLNGGYGFHTIWMNIPRFIKELDVQAFRAGLDALAPALPATRMSSPGAAPITAPETHFTAPAAGAAR